MVTRRPRASTVPRPNVTDTRVVGWQWEATTLPIPASDWDSVAEAISKAVVDLHSREVRLHELDVTMGDGNDSIVKVSNASGPDSFALDVTRSRIVYRHEPTVVGVLAVGDHITRVARHLLEPIGHHVAITRRLLSAGSAYELKSSVRGGNRPNLDRLTRDLLSPLATRPWEKLPSKRRTLERIDLKWAVDTELTKMPATLWFKVSCPANGEHTTLDTTVVIQSSAAERIAGLPSAQWAVNAVSIHAEVWPTVTGFLTWMLRTRR